MGLSFWHRDVSYDSLLKLLNVRPYGAPAGNINDPHMPDAPIAVPRGDFDLAWLERDGAFALIELSGS